MDSQQLADLFDHHHQHLYRMGLRMLNSPQDAEDLLQETFLKAWRAAKRMPREAKGAKAWLIRILVNSCRDRYRRKAVRGEVNSDGFEDFPAKGDVENAQMAKHTVRRALAALPAKRRAVMILHELEGLPPPEVAAMLGMRPVTVRWHLSKGRKAMNVWIQEKEQGHDARRSQSISQKPTGS